MDFRSAIVVDSRLTSWRTRLFSVRNSKDLITLTVMVADAFGRAKFVRTVDTSPTSVLSETIVCEEEEMV